MTRRKSCFILHYGVIMDMWKNLKALRDENGMKQEEFGATVGVKKSTYSNYETGATEPPARFWIAVSDRYKRYVPLVED